MFWSFHKLSKLVLTKKCIVILYMVNIKKIFKNLGLNTSSFSSSTSAHSTLHMKLQNDQIKSSLNREPIGIWPWGPRAKAAIGRAEAKGSCHREILIFFQLRSKLKGKGRGGHEIVITWDCPGIGRCVETFKCLSWIVGVGVTLRRNQFTNRLSTMHYLL